MMEDNGLEDWGLDGDAIISDDLGDVGEITPPKPKFKVVPLGSLSNGRMVATVFTGLIFSCILGFITYALYMKQIKYPSEQEVVVESTGLYCLQNWESSLQSMESLGEDSYIAQEVVYANGNENKVNFYKKMLSTVKYTPSSVLAKNKYGNDLIDQDTNQVVYRDSWIEEGEEVTLSFVDYTQIEVDPAIVLELMTENKIALGDVDYNNKLVDIFCQYMSNLPLEEIPIRSIAYTPNMQKSGSAYEILPDEDILIDRLLFSSSDLYDLMDRFSIVAGEVSKGVTVSPSELWLKWDSLSDEEKATTEEPTKYNYKQVVDKSWCGVYYLQNGYSTVDTSGNTVSASISADVGDGTLANPAGLNTGVLTTIYVDEEVKEKKKTSIVTNAYPIKVSMIEYGVSEDAINWFESKDTKNRGLDISSEVQFCYYVFEVTNMSDRELTITDNSGICDENANLSPRTGVLYGLQTSVTLQPDETGIIESWNKSTELNKKYVIWGSDFARRTEPVWFRVLAGNIDDESEDKGVTLNKTRDQEETEEPTTEAPITEAEMEE